MAPGGREQVRF